MGLNEYIDKQGAKRCAELFGVSLACIYHWRKGIRTPRPRQADTIVEKTHGLVGYAGIYGKAS